MLSSFSKPLLLGSALLSTAFAASGLPSFDDCTRVLHRDVAILGGGSAGTHAAVRLKQHGKSVAVIEAKAVIGGHAETWVDPATGTHVGLGVVLWDNVPIVRRYADSLGVGLKIVNNTQPMLRTQYIDFRDGKPFEPEPAADAAAATRHFAAQLAKYPWLNDGFELPDPIPADLLLPFGDFLKKYNLEGFVRILVFFDQGAGNVLEQTTLYMLKYSSDVLLQDLVKHFLVCDSGDQRELYDAAAAYLGDAVLLQSHVVRADRSGAGVKLLVQTPHDRVRIEAKHLIVAAPPTLPGLAELDLSPDERRLFGQFQSTGYYTGVLRGTGLPGDVRVVSGRPDTPSNLAPMPALYNFLPSGAPNVTEFKYGSEAPLPPGEALQRVLADLQRLRAAGYDVPENPTVEAYSEHVPFFLRVPAAAIRAGFYRELNALQGARNTWYTGAAWQTQDSSLIWNFTEAKILPKLLA